jgi:hypothetical protein
VTDLLREFVGLLAGQEEMKAKEDADREQMLARINAYMRNMQEKADADRKADREGLKGIMNATLESMDVNTKAMGTNGEADRFSTLRNRGRQKD